MLGTHGMLGSAANKFRVVRDCSDELQSQPLQPGDSTVTAAVCVCALMSLPPHPAPLPHPKPSLPPRASTQPKVMADKDNKRMLSIVSGMVIVLLALYWLLHR